MYRSKKDNLTDIEINSLMCLVGDHSPEVGLMHMQKVKNKYGYMLMKKPNGSQQEIIATNVEFGRLWNKLQGICKDV